MLEEAGAIHETEMLQAKTSCLMTALDRQISRQLTEVIKHPSLKTFEASWRNLAYLITQAARAKKVKIYLLPLSKVELSKDLTWIQDFDASEIFKRIYNHGFGIAGGEPFNVIIGDYEFANTVGDIEILKVMAQIAAAAFAPFIAGAAPALLGLNHFDELGRMPDLTRIFNANEYFFWRELRLQEDMRFVALVLPHHLLRLPYRHRLCKSYFQYKDAQPETGYLWGNAAFAFVAMLIKNFDGNAWFANICGSKGPDDETNAVPLPNFAKSVRYTLAPDLPVDAIITDNQERALKELGLMSLCLRVEEQIPVFYSCPSLQQMMLMKDDQQQVNHRTNSLLNYLLCACRFVHYLKAITRDKIGSFVTIDECAEYLNFWLAQYAAANTDLAFTQRVKFPLQSGQVKIRAEPTRTDFYFCTIHIKPFFQLEQLKGEFIFITELNFKTNHQANL
jgi:type VI secretion system protein ImpD